VVGPTGSGKTALAVDLAEALGGEVVSADSVQVYRHFEIGSGKPTPEERARAPHHLIGAIEPDDKMDAARFASLAEACLSDIRTRGKRPIVCGGTFLWIRALLFGLAPAPPGDGAIRERHRRAVESHGRPALHAELSVVDPDSAARLNPNDFVRVSRALEVHELTGTPLSSWHAAHGFREPRHSARLFGITWPRTEHDERIAARVRSMLEAGWVDEVRALLDAGYRDSRAMHSVGYRQIAEAVESGAAIDDSLGESIARATRVFARRQRTWLRDQPVELVDPGAGAEAVTARLAALR
jgi:tRNA dimethylallyltransferase